MISSFPIFRPFLLAFCLMIGSGAVAAEAERQVPENTQQITLSFAPLVRQAAPAVVNIYSRRVVQERRLSPLFDDPFFRRFFGDGMPMGPAQERVQNSLGSGVIVRQDGLIVTNAHVIKDADQITAVLADRREFEAKVVALDERTDLAVLRVDTRGVTLPYLEFRDSDDLEVGDLVLAIGNPFGVGQTVTSGIVSALARTAAGVSDYNFFIQTDAAINPGNSGGALIATDGRLVGINTAIYSRSGGSLGIGFAIPSNMVRAVITAVETGGRIVRPWVGVTAQPMTADIAVSLGLDRPMGVLVTGVDPRSPAGQADLRVGDIVTEIDGKEVDGPEALRFRVATLPIGGEVRFTVLRAGRTREIAVPLRPPPEDPPRDISQLSGPTPLSGATVANLSPALVEEIGFDGPASGVVVLEVARGSAAGRLRLQAGDIVRAVNDRPVDSVRGLVETLRQGTSGWKITIERRGRRLNIMVSG